MYDTYSHTFINSHKYGPEPGNISIDKRNKITNCAICTFPIQHHLTEHTTNNDNEHSLSLSIKKISKKKRQGQQHNDNDKRSDVKW